MQDHESKILRDFLTGPLSVDSAVSRLVAIGYQEGDALDLVEEWVEAEHLNRERHMVFISAPWGYINLPAICDISQALAIRIMGPTCPVRPARY